jgi:hypothetical protein
VVQSVKVTPATPMGCGGGGVEDLRALAVKLKGRATSVLG